MKYPLNTFSEETQKEIMVLIEQAYKQGVSDVVLEKEETDVANSEHDDGFISGCNWMIDRLEEKKANLLFKFSDIPEEEKKNMAYNK